MALTDESRMQSSSDQKKMFWMNKSLEKAWKDENNEHYAWLLNAASKLGQLAVNNISPIAMPVNILSEAAQAMSNQAPELIIGAHGMFDKDHLHMSKAEEAKLKNEKGLLRALGQSAVLFVWSALGAASPIVGGIILVTAGLTYLLKREKIASQKRWEEITASMMEKYANILQKVQAQKDARRLFYEGIEQARIEEFTVSQQKNEESKKGTLSSGALIRLYIYLDYFLNFKIDPDEHPKDILAKVYAVISKDVEKRSDDTFAFDEDKSHDAEYKRKQEEKVWKVLNDIDERKK